MPVPDFLRTLYERGLDARFQAAHAVSVVVNELLVRLAYAIRRMLSYGSRTKPEERSFSGMWKACDPFTGPSVDRMLTVAHGAFCALDLADAIGQEVAMGVGTFNWVECLLRVNFIGAGRFAICLYKQARHVMARWEAAEEARFAEKKMAFVNSYLAGLDELGRRYDDRRYLTCVEDLKRSDSYKNAVMKTASLARLREVPEDQILDNEEKIDAYFGGSNR